MRRPVVDLVALLAVLLIVPLGGCGSGAETGVANPSAVFCEEQGGTYTLDDETCTLPDGSVVDAWDYYREEAGEGS